MSALRPPPPGYRISTRPLPYWRYVHDAPRDMSGFSVYNPNPEAVMEAFDRMVRKAKGE